MWSERDGAIKGSIEGCPSAGFKHNGRRFGAKEFRRLLAFGNNKEIGSLLDPLESNIVPMMP